jgi:NAD(P)H dehydrogenase (quinone)
VTPNDIAATFTKLLGRSVRMEVVPRESWEALFKSQGMKNPIPRIRMLDGFNEGWIEFEGGEVGSQKGNESLESVLKALIEREANTH